MKSVFSVQFFCKFKTDLRKVSQLFFQVGAKAKWKELRARAGPRAMRQGAWHPLWGPVGKPPHAQGPGASARLTRSPSHVHAFLAPHFASPAQFSFGLLETA